MKRAILLIVAAALLAACGGGSSSVAAKPSTPPGPVTKYRNMLPGQTADAPIDLIQTIIDFAPGAASVGSHAYVFQPGHSAAGPGHRQDAVRRQAGIRGGGARRAPQPAGPGVQQRLRRGDGGCGASPCCMGQNRRHRSPGSQLLPRPIRPSTASRSPRRASAAATASYSRCSTSRRAPKRSSTITAALA